MAQAAGSSDQDDVVENETHCEFPRECVFLFLFEPTERKATGNSNPWSLEYHVLREGFELVDDMEGWKNDPVSPVFIDLVRKSTNNRVESWELIPHLEIKGYSDAVKKMMTRLRSYAKRWDATDSVFEILNSARRVLENRVKEYKRHGSHADAGHRSVIRMWHRELRTTYEASFINLCLELTKPEQVPGTVGDAKQDEATSKSSTLKNAKTTTSGRSSSTGYIRRLKERFRSLRTCWSEGKHREKVFKLLKIAMINVEYLLWWSRQSVGSSSHKWDIKQAELWRRLVLHSLPFTLGDEDQFWKLQIANAPRKLEFPSNDSAYHVRIEIDSIRITALYSTNFCVSYLPLETYLQLQRNMMDMKEPVGRVHEFAGQEVKCFGMTRRKIKMTDASVVDQREPQEINFHVAELNLPFECILGLDFQKPTNFPYLVLHPFDKSLP